MSADRLRELFDQHAELPGDGQPVQALTWEMFEAAARALLASHGTGAMSESHLEPPELDVPQVLARDWINRHGIFRTVSTGGQQERTGTDWGMVITEAARWGQRQGFEAAARALLAEAQPQPGEPTDPAWREFIEAVQHAQHVAVREGESPRFDLVATAFALWRSAAPEPVSVAERLPTAADCDAHERCWWLEVGSDDDAPTHWLPYWALPVPLPTTEQ